MAHTPYIGPDGKEWPSITRVSDVLAKPQLYAYYAKHELIRCITEAKQCKNLAELKKLITVWEALSILTQKDPNYGKAWAANDNKEDAADVGTLFHDGIYNRFNGTPPTNPLTPQAQAMVDKFFDEFVKPYKVAVESMEQKVVSNEFRTHGTYDAIVKVTDMPIGRARTKYTGRVLADWKQSNGIYDSHGLQLGGYWLCTPNPPQDGLIIQINRETLDMRKKLFNDLRWYAEEFKAARDLYDYVNHQGVWERT